MLLPFLLHPTAPAPTPHPASHQARQPQPRRGRRTGPRTAPARTPRPGRTTPEHDRRSQSSSADRTGHIRPDRRPALPRLATQPPPPDRLADAASRSRPASAASAAAISCRYSSKTASAGLSGEGCQPAGSLRSTGSPAATPWFGHAYIRDRAGTLLVETVPQMHAAAANGYPTGSETT